MKKAFYISFLLFLSVTAGAQIIETEFGKNRVQYHDDFDTWKKYETENFITYWYGKAQNIAVPGLQIAEQEHDRVRDIMEHRINDKIKLLIYTDITDFKQSNIGVDEVLSSKDKVTKVEDNKIFVYFKGDHSLLRKDISEGIAAVYLNEMMLGSNIREMVKNAVRLDIPEWYEKGIISYAGSEWDYLLDDEMRDILSQKDRFWNFYKMAERFPKMAGHSFWYYIKESYGESTISNLLYLTKISRSLDEAMLYVLNRDLDQVVEGWAEFYKKHYAKEKDRFADDSAFRIDLKNKKDVPVSYLALSPMKKHLAYATNNNGRIHIYIRDLETGDEKRIYRYGSKNNLQATDYNYPLMAWNDSGTEISYVVEKKDLIYLRKYDLRSGQSMEQLIPTRYDRIYSIDYVSDDEYLFSAMENGFSDLFIYETRNRTSEKLSNDFYDDRDASVVTFAGKKGILFSSNRENNRLGSMRYDTILPTGDFNLFFYDLESGDGSLLRLTDTPDRNERYPIIVDDKHVLFMDGKTGMMNAYVYHLLDNDSYVVTNKPRNIIRHDYLDGTYVYTYYIDGGYEVFLEEIITSEKKIVPLTSYNQSVRASSEVVIPLEIEQKKDTILPGFLFQSEFGEGKKKSVPKEEKGSDSPLVKFIDEGNSDGRVHDFKPTDIIPARIQFRISDFETKMDNEVLFEGLESYVGNQRSVFTPLGFLVKGDLLDMMEDYRLIAGVRIPFNLKGSEYFMVYEDRKKRIDKTYALYRKTYNTTTDELAFPIERQRQVSLLGMTRFSYPFDIFRSVRLTTSLRFDKQYYISSELRTFNQPIIDQKRLLVKLEYVFDNSTDYAVNIKHGSRYKIYAEGINDFNIEFGDDNEFDLSRGITGIVGFDARHYIELFRHSVVALRGVGATSFGTNRNLFYLGGVNNNLLDRFNTNTPTLRDGSFAYQTNIFHLRGFNSNIRNGSSYALVNTEIRIPFLRYILNPYRASSFWKNFQIVGFFDIGTAWYGASPYSDKNPLNTISAQSTSGNGSPIVTIDAQYYRDPLVMGFGAGIRAYLLGYMLRLDYARGFETNEFQDRIIHVSLGMDF